jgi:hypothetical protein
MPQVKCPPGPPGAEHQVAVAVDRDWQHAVLWYRVAGVWHEVSMGYDGIERRLLVGGPDRCWVVPRFGNEAEEQELLFAVDVLLSKDPDTLRRIPYGFGASIEELLVSPEAVAADGWGFSCATFIETVYAHAGLPLFDRADWESSVSDARRRRDQHRMRALVRSRKLSDDRRAWLLKNLPEVAPTPCEVAGASGVSDRPLSLARGEAVGRCVEEALGLPPPAPFFTT